MKRNVTMSIAAGLLIAAAVAQADDMLVAGEFQSENVIIDRDSVVGAGGSAFEPLWKEEYPFPVQYGTAVD